MSRSKSKTGLGNLISQRKSLKDIKEMEARITTGSLRFDDFLDGGFRPGIARFYAPSEHGKTSQALLWANNWLNHFKERAEIYIFDAEGRITESKLKAAGLLDSPYYWEGEDGESGSVNLYVYNIYDEIAEFIFNKVMDNPKGDKGKRYFFMIDSLDMLITSDNFKKSFSEAEKIGAAQTISALVFKKVGIYMAERGHHFHILSQIRANINTNNPNSPKTKVSGGNAMLHGSSLTGEIQKDWSDMYIYENPTGKTVAEKGKVIGKYHTIKFVKTFNDKTHQVLRIPIKFGHGIWKEREIADILMEYSLVVVAGSWVKFNEDIHARLCGAIKKEVPASIQGINNFYTYLEENKDVCDWFEGEIKNALPGFAGERVEDDEIVFEEDLED